MRTGLKLVPGHIFGFLFIWESLLKIDRVDEELDRMKKLDRFTTLPMSDEIDPQNQCAGFLQSIPASPVQLQWTTSEEIRSTVKV